MESDIASHDKAGLGPRGRTASMDSAPDLPMAERDVTLPWGALLGATIASEVLPRLLSAHRQPWDAQAGAAFAEDGGLGCAAVEAFLALIVADDMEQARTVADRVVVQYGSREALLDDLLTPVARRLGEMWEQDLCDFMTVTLGVYRLDQIMKETATAAFMGSLGCFHEYRILLLPVPGEQHSFGLGMVADVFREAGWCVRSGPAAGRSQLLGLVREEWFDVVGLSVASDRNLRGLPGCIRALRQASCNPDMRVMLGGRAVMDDPERTRFLGADATAMNAQEAISLAKVFMEGQVTGCLRQSKTRLVDMG
jgi:methanogenic corrinoid protein MtbC1